MRRLLVALAVLCLGGLAVAVTAGRDGGGSVGAAQSAPAPTAGAGPGGAPEAAPEDRPVRLTVTVGGDLLPHLPVVQRAQALAGGDGYDFAPLLLPIRPIIRGADLALCHLETPIGRGPPVGYPQFRGPAELADAIRATGWDACSTASNHTLDGGQPGIDATLRTLDRAGLRHTGSYRDARGRARTLMLRVKGVKLAFLAYTATTNGLVAPHPWSVNMAAAPRIVRDARRARRRGARAVLVNLHWGTEYRQTPDPAQRALARRLAASRAITAVFGQHAHVVQPIRRVRGRWTVFGAGNLLSNQTAACCHPAAQDGMVVALHLAVGQRTARVERVTYTPTWVRHPDFTVLPVGRALRRDEADAATLRASYERTVGVAGRAPGLRPIPARLPH